MWRHFVAPLLTFSLLRSIYCHWRLLSYIFIYKKTYCAWAVVNGSRIMLSSDSDGFRHIRGYYGAMVAAYVVSVFVIGHSIIRTGLIPGHDSR